MKSTFFLLLLASFLWARTYKITKVHSGDSLEDSKGETIRLLGVICPGPNEPYGTETHEFVKSILEGKIVTLHFDGDTERRDSAGTIYSYVHLVCDTCEGASFKGTSQAKNVISINAPLIDICGLLLKKGMCRVDTVHACEKRSYFNYLQRVAKKNGAGIWKAPGRAGKQQENK